MFGSSYDKGHGVLILFNITDSQLPVICYKTGYIRPFKSPHYHRCYLPAIIFDHELKTCQYFSYNYIWEQNSSKKIIIYRNFIRKTNLFSSAPIIWLQYPSRAQILTVKNPCFKWFVINTLYTEYYTLPIIRSLYN